jgi:metal-responsive CopG/Arc/MetJ family transcriptional regulator
MTRKKVRIGRPPLAPDSALYSLRLPASLMRQVDAQAKAAGVTRSEALRAIIAAGLKGGRHGRS